MLTYFLLFCCCINLGYAQYPIPENKTCKTVCKSLKIEPESLLGIWYLIKHIPFYFTEGTTCTYINITNSTEINRHLQRVEIINGITYVSNGSSIVEDGLRSSVFDSAKANYTFSIPGKVVGYSPDAMAVVSCFECGFYSKNGSGLYASIYSRLQFPPCEQIDAKIDSLKTCGIPPEAFTEVSHLNCAQTC